MKKILINRSNEMFYLTNECIEIYMKLKYNRKVYKYRRKFEYYEIEPENYIYRQAPKSFFSQICLTEDKGRRFPAELFNNYYKTQCYINPLHIRRDDPYLIQAVEKSYFPGGTKLMIIEVPDNVRVYLSFDNQGEILREFHKTYPEEDSIPKEFIY